MMQLLGSAGPMSNFDGQPGSQAMVANNDLIPRNMRIQSINQQNFDPVLRDRIDQLNNLKNQAVESEDYDGAKHYKGIVDKLMIMGNQLI